MKIKGHPPVSTFMRCASYNNKSIVIINKPEPIKEPTSKDRKLDKFV